MFAEQTEVPQKLRALWALHVIGKLETEFLITQLAHPSEYVVGWAVQLLCENGTPPAEALATFRDLSDTGESQLVRLHIASMLQRLPLADRWTIAEALSQKIEDVDDDNLPLMLWYGMEPLVTADLERFVGIAGITRLPLVARHIGRRVASLPKSPEGLNLLTGLFANVENEIQPELLAGVLEGLAGRRSVEMPAAWPPAYSKLQTSKDEIVRERALQLALVFDDPIALSALRKVAADTTAAAASRNRAINSLVAKQAVDVTPILLALVDDPATQRAAIRGLAEYDDTETPTVLLERYQALDMSARQDAIQTLASRPAWAHELMDAVADEKVPRSDLSAYTARQLYNLKDAKLSERIESLWGKLRTSAADKTALVASYTKKLPLASIQKADRVAGRALFQKTCANCHRIFGEGGKIGPDITGSQRTNLDYLLQTLIDPSAAVAKDYQMQIIETTGGRIITGLIVDETPAALTIQTVNEKVIVPVAEIESRAVSPLSMMPEGMLQNLTTDQVRNLLSYLMGPGQVTLPEPAATQ